MIKYYGVFDQILKYYIKDVSRVLKLNELLNGDYLNMVKMSVGSKLYPVYGSVHVAKQPFCIAYTNETNKQDTVTFDNDALFVTLMTCNSLKHNVFVIAHELKHVEQLASKRLDTNYNWEGKNYRSLIGSFQSISDYMNLPWEKDANDFARQYISSKKLPVSVDFQNKLMLYMKYRKVYKILRFINES